MSWLTRVDVVTAVRVETVSGPPLALQSQTLPSICDRGGESGESGATALAAVATTGRAVLSVVGGVSMLVYITLTFMGRVFHFIGRAALDAACDCGGD